MAPGRLAGDDQLGQRVVPNWNVRSPLCVQIFNVANCVFQEQTLVDLPREGREHEHMC